MHSAFFFHLLLLLNRWIHKKSIFALIMRRKTACKHNWKHSWPGDDFTLSAQLPFAFSWIVCFFLWLISLKGSQSQARPRSEQPVIKTPSADCFPVSSDLLSGQKSLLMYMLGRLGNFNSCCALGLSDSMEPYGHGNWCVSGRWASEFSFGVCHCHAKNTNSAASEKNSLKKNSPNGQVRGDQK